MKIDYNINKSNFEPQFHYSNEKVLSDFYTEMNHDSCFNDSRVIWEWLKNAPCISDFDISKFKIWLEDGHVVCVARPTSPWPGEAIIDNRSVSDETINDIINYTEQNLYI